MYSTKTIPVCYNIVWNNPQPQKFIYMHVVSKESHKYISTENLISKIVRLQLQNWSTFQAGKLLPCSQDWSLMLPLAWWSWILIYCIILQAILHPKNNQWGLSDRRAGIFKNPWKHFMNTNIQNRRIPERNEVEVTVRY